MVEEETQEVPPIQFGDRSKLDAEVEKMKQRGQREPVEPTLPKRISVSVAQSTQTVSCVDCKRPFEAETLVMDGTTIVLRMCPECSETRKANALNDARVEMGKRIETLWQELCPALYRDTDRARLGIPPGVIEQVTTWTVNPKGIGLSGESGTGKTRLMFLLLRELHFGGVRCRAITAKRFEKWCHRMFDKDDSARQNIKSAHRVAVLFIDDIGKEKYTERVESEFYDLIEYRTSNLLPILWTANATGDQLVRMMGEDRGVPIVRRLREFATVISV